MKCPIDQNQLVITERQGIEIDYCPECRGVWLDRGELDKMIDRADAYGATSRPAEPAPRREEPREEYRSSSRDNYGHHDPRDYNDKRPHKKKRESFLGDLFEFGD